MIKTVLGIFEDYQGGSRGIDILERAGFDADEISVVIQSDVAKERLAEHREERVVEDAGAGLVGGAVVGGLLGLLAGAVTLSLPGVGPVVAAGSAGTVLLSTATGAGIGGAYGGFAGALVGMGMSEEEAHLYIEGLKQGHMLVAVEIDTAGEGGESRVWKAENALHQAQALNVRTWPGKWREEKET